MSIQEVRKWHVSLIVPDEVATRYHETQEWNHKMCNATSGNIEAGTNRYAEHEEWADFWTKDEAKQCERKLIAVIQYFEMKMIEDKEKERQEDEDV